MNDLKRLIDFSHSGATRALLRAGLDDEPPASLLPRLALTLGVAVPAATLLVPSSAVAAKALTAGVSAAGVAKATLGVSVVELSKWLAAGVVSGVLVSGAVVTVDRLRPAASSTASVGSPARDVAPQSPRDQRTLPARPAAPEAEAPAAPEVELPSRSPAPVTSTKSPAHAPTPDSPRSFEPHGPGASGDSRALGREAARIDAARRALATGDLGSASRELDAYARERVVGVLDREAELLRIQLQVRSGDAEGARARARRYLEQNPNDAHAARLREIAYPKGVAP